MRRLLSKLPWLVAVVAVALLVGEFFAPVRSDFGQAVFGRWSFVKLVTNDPKRST